MLSPLRCLLCLWGRQGSSVLPFHTTDRRPSEVKQPPQAHAAHGSKELTCQGRAKCGLLSVFSFLISNPWTTSCATPGLSGFPEGPARWPGPQRHSHGEGWGGLPCGAIQAVRGLTRPTWSSPFPTPTWAASGAYSTPGYCQRSAPARFTPLSGCRPCPHPQRVRNRKNAQSQPILECCAQDCFTNKRWAGSGTDHRLGLADQRAGGHQP